MSSYDPESISGRCALCENRAFEMRLTFSNHLICSCCEGILTVHGFVMPGEINEGWHRITEKDKKLGLLPKAKANAQNPPRNWKKLIEKSHERLLPLWEYFYYKYPQDWEARTRAVRLRDDNRCRHCMSSANLIVHHKVPVEARGDHFLDNLLTLCNYCHMREHPAIADEIQTRRELMDVEYKKGNFSLMSHAELTKYGGWEHEVGSLKGIFSRKVEGDILHPPRRSIMASEVHSALSLLMDPHNYEVCSRNETEDIWAFYFEKNSASESKRLLCTWAVEGLSDRWWIRPFANFFMDCGTPWLTEQEARHKEGLELFKFISGLVAENKDRIGDASKNKSVQQDNLIGPTPENCTG